MTREEFLSKYWKYYLLLEEQFLNTNNYVDLNTDNFSTYSLQFVNSILLTGAELDTIMKLYCNFILSDRKDISNYANHILTNDSGIINQEIIVFNGGNLIIKPFDGWQTVRSSETLKGWKEYNVIKHNRNENFKLATLENALNLLGCLYILEIQPCQSHLCRCFLLFHRLSFCFVYSYLCCAKACKFDWVQLVYFCF